MKHSGGSKVGVASVGHAVFAVVLIALGIQGFLTSDFTVVWQPVPGGVPARHVLIYVCAAISLGSGIGLLARAVSAIAARVLLASLVVWFLLWRVRALFTASLVDSTWSCGETLAILAAAWVLYVVLAPRGKGLRVARRLYGLALFPFGYAHFAYLQHTAEMVPGWLPWHVGWAYLTGCTFLAAGVAIVAGRLAGLATALSALQMGLFGLLVWIPMAVAGPLSAFQRGEIASTVVLTAAGWVVADSYRATR